MRLLRANEALNLLKNDGIQGPLFSKFFDRPYQAIFKPAKRSIITTDTENQREYTIAIVSRSITPESWNNSGKI